MHNGDAIADAIPVVDSVSGDAEASHWRERAVIISSPMKRARILLCAWSLHGFIACGGASPSAPQGVPAVATATPIPVPIPSVRASPGDVASAMTGLPIPGGQISPPLSTAPTDATVLEISAPGHFPIRTTRGYMRQKGDRVFLVPLDFDAEFFDTRYLSTSTGFYNVLSFQWAVKVLGVYINPAISSTGLRTSIATAVNAMSRTLESVDSSIRMEMSQDPNAPVTVEISPTITRAVSGVTRANSLRTDSATLHLKDLQPVDSVEIYQVLFWMMSQHQIANAGRSFTSFPGARTTAPTPLDLAILRIQTNRCAGAQFEDDRGVISRARGGRETELRTAGCVFPPL